MDPRLLAVVRCNSLESFVDLVGEDAEILKQRSEQTGNTVLHLAVKHGHVELVKEILRLCPEMAAAENLKQETPFHEACAHGHADILLLLLETDPWASSNLSHENQGLLFLACSRGHVEAVKILLNQQWLHNLNDDNDGGLDPACLLEAASRGHLDVVKEILAKFPDLGVKVDEHGYSGLHKACSSGHANVVRFLLSLHPQLARQFTNFGYLPLHLAAMNGKTAIFTVFIELAPLSFMDRTEQGEPIIHLPIRYNQFDTFLLLVKIFSKDDLFFHSLDKDGNTLLHVAALSEKVKFIEYLINDKRIPVNSQNNQGLTAFDMLDPTIINNTEEFDVLEDMLRNAGGERGRELTGNLTTIDSFDRNLEDRLHQILLDHHEKEEGRIENENALNSQAMEENQNWSVTKKLREQKRLSQERRKLLVSKMDKNHARRQKQHDMYKEALQNARNTVTLVAALITTVTFSAGISPPGGVHQDGPLMGKSIFGKTKGYKVFVISNSIALSTSLCIMLVLVSIIPFKKRLLLRLLMITHKVMWVSVAFMATAFTSATWMTMPQDYKTHWLPNMILAVVGGIMGTLFIYLGLALVRHWMRKLKWRREKAKETSVVVPVDVESTEDQSSAANTDVERVKKLFSFSSNSDFASSRGVGGHPV